MEERIRVLLVEDHDTEALLLQEMLFRVSPAKFDLTHVTRLTAGLDELAQGDYDVVLLDLLLPDSEGLATFSKIHAEAPDSVPIIVLSGLDDKELAVEAVRRGAQDYLVKTDIDGRLLARSIRYAIERKQTLKAMHERAVELQLRNEELDAFSHTVAHDLRSPLTIMLGFAELAQEDYDTISGKELLYYIRQILKQGRKLNTIVDELLLLSSVRRSEIALECLDMISIIGAALERLQYQIEDSDPDIRVPEALPAALGHAPWVEEVWFNYLSNALRHCPASPTLRIGGQRISDDEVRFWVRDDGPGIPQAEQAQLFVPFTQISQVKSDGYGLGLSIVRRIIERLGGRVGVDSELGEGSTFYFVLPAANRAPNEGAA